MSRTIESLITALKAAAQEEIMFRESSDTSDQWQDEATPENVLKLVEALSAKQAEPVAYMTYKGYLIHAGDPKLLEYSDPQPLYDTPPANSPVVPEGWKLLPEEATLAMLTLLGLTGSFESMQERYANMLAAAPEKPL